MVMLMNRNCIYGQVAAEYDHLLTIQLDSQRQVSFAFNLFSVGYG